MKIEKTIEIARTNLKQIIDNYEKNPESQDNNWYDYNIGRWHVLDSLLEIINGKNANDFLQSTE